jgi:hypothetical protein
MTKTAVTDPREQETRDKREKTKTGMVKIRRKKLWRVKLQGYRETRRPK